jgi:hypothetical protein
VKKTISREDAKTRRGIELQNLLFVLFAASREELLIGDEQEIAKEASL